MQRRPQSYELTADEIARVTQYIRQDKIPVHRVPLLHHATPIEPFRLPNIPEGAPAVFIKRDDMTGGVELTGNKLRKLEFLLADALHHEADCVVTVGGTQSNHCRATIAACRRLTSLGYGCHATDPKGNPSTCAASSLQPIVVLRDDGHTMTSNGNIFLDRLLGAEVEIISRATYIAAGGGAAVMRKKCQELVSANRKPYGIIVGGSDWTGSWGYVECCRAELFPSPPRAGDAEEATPRGPWSHIVSAAGSGGTLTGLALGSLFFHDRAFPGYSRPQIRAYGVCDNDEYFYDVVDGLLNESTIAERSLPNARSLCRVVDVHGLGYGKSTDEELQYLSLTARTTGLVFDPTYTNKAVFGLANDLRNGVDGLADAGGRVLFVHTGGGPSVFEAKDRLLPHL